MSSSSHQVNARTSGNEQRHMSWDLQQHDSATTLDLPGSMDRGKSELAGLDQQTLRDFGMAAKRAGSITSGFNSRETSPERGSIASYRAPSRPGTAHSYSAADVKKLYAGRQKLHFQKGLCGAVLPHRAVLICSWAKVICTWLCQKAWT